MRPDFILFAEDTVSQAEQNVQENVSIDWQKVLDTIVEWCTTTGIWSFIVIAIR